MMIPGGQSLKYTNTQRLTLNPKRIYTLKDKMWIVFALFFNCPIDKTTNELIDNEPYVVIDTISANIKNRSTLIASTDVDKPNKADLIYINTVCSKLISVLGYKPTIDTISDKLSFTNGQPMLSSYLANYVQLLKIKKDIVLDKTYKELKELSELYPTPMVAHNGITPIK